MTGVRLGTAEEEPHSREMSERPEAMLVTVEEYGRDEAMREYTSGLENYLICIWLHQN